MQNSISSLNMLYNAIEINAEFYSLFLPRTNHLTGCCCQKREVSLRFFAKNPQYDPKRPVTRTKLSVVAHFLATALSYVMRFRQKRGRIENFKYLAEFEKDF
jgi:hypothetical protein